MFRLYLFYCNLSLIIGHDHALQCYLNKDRSFIMLMSSGGARNETKRGPIATIITSKDGNRSGQGWVELPRTRPRNPRSKPDPAPKLNSGANVHPHPKPAGPRNPTGPPETRTDRYNIQIHNRERRRPGGAPAREGRRPGRGAGQGGAPSRGGAGQGGTPARDSRTGRGAVQGGGRPGNAVQPAAARSPSCAHACVGAGGGGYGLVAWMWMVCVLWTELDFRVI
jgi:hypothetical protein